MGGGDVSARGEGPRALRALTTLDLALCSFVGADVLIGPPPRARRPATKCGSQAILLFGRTAWGGFQREGRCVPVARVHRFDRGEDETIGPYEGRESRDGRTLCAPTRAKDKARHVKDAVPYIRSTLTPSPPNRSKAVKTFTNSRISNFRTTISQKSVPFPSTPLNCTRLHIPKNSKPRFSGPNPPKTGSNHPQNRSKSNFQFSYNFLFGPAPF